jgi:drug/metabolite transporter (DMT)-like permease
MPSTSIACGLLLILVGIVGYVYGMMNNAASVTALIPAFFGIVLAILGFLAQTKENLRKHLMHAAVLIAFIGFLITAGRLLSKISTLTLSAAVISQAAMALICLVFVILCVKSFIDARKVKN